MVKSRPYVILSAAITLDGKLGVKTKEQNFLQKMIKFVCINYDQKLMQ